MKTRLRIPTKAVLLVLLALPPSVLAQAKPKITINPPPGEAAWMVRFSYDKPLEAKSPEGEEAAKSLEAVDLARPATARYLIKKLVSTRTVTFEGGTKMEAYQWESYEFQKSPSHKGVIMRDLRSYPSVEQLYRKTFPGVHWVTPAQFVEVQKAYGQECAYFRDDTPEKADETKMDAVLDASKYQTREAWFSMATGLPVAYRTGAETGEFTFTDPPADPVSVPGDVRESMTKMVEYNKYLERRAQLGRPTP